MITRLLKRVLKVVLGPVIPWMRRWQGAHVHVVIARRDGTSAFGMIGAARWRDPFARFCLGDDTPYRLHHRLHRANWSSVARRLASRHGVVLATETPVPDDIASSLIRWPTWVALRVDLGASEAEFVARLPRSARSDVKHPRMKELTWRVRADDEWAREFHDQFHRPSMVARHGEAGHVLPAAQVADMLRDTGGEFVCAMLEGRCVGAMLCEPQPHQYVTRRIGWLNGDPAWTKRGVVAALYWFSMQRARERGYRAIQIGATPSYLEHGLFQFKAKWGAAIDATETVWGDHFLLLSPEHADVSRLLNTRSLVARNDRNEFFVLSGRLPREVQLTKEIATSIARWYRLRSEPDAAHAADNRDLPARLRPWFALEERSAMS